MGSKMSTNQNLLEARARSEERRLRESSSMSSAMENVQEIAREDEEEEDEESDYRDEGNCDFVDGNCGTKPEDLFQVDDHDHDHEREEGGFDINENFDYESDGITIDSDVMTMDSICDGFDVVELSNYGTGKRHRTTRDSMSAGDDVSEPDAASDRMKSSRTDVAIPNGSISHASPRRTGHGEAVNPVVYKMEYAKRGRAIVVNQTHFDPITGMSNREGTDPDIEGLERVFNRLGFRVETHCDLTVSEFRKLLHEVSSEDFRHDDCFAFVAMSHGEEGVLYCKDGTVCIDEVALRFKGDMCPSLVGKPKLFFFQACRGTLMDHGVRTRATQGDDEPDAAVEQKMFYTIPVEADFLMAYSSTPGYYSWRSLREGSWFIQALITILDKYGSCMDVIQMMTRVNRTVAYRYESMSSDERYNGRKQMPCFVSTLTKELYFIPKKGS